MFTKTPTCLKLAKSITHSWILFHINELYLLGQKARASQEHGRWQGKGEELPDGKFISEFRTPGQLSIISESYILCFFNWEQKTTAFLAYF